jgi:hypothetical protein
MCLVTSDELSPPHRLRQLLRDGRTTPGVCRLLAGTPVPAPISGRTDPSHPTWAGGTLSGG